MTVKFSKSDNIISARLKKKNTGETYWCSVTDAMLYKNTNKQYSIDFLSTVISIKNVCTIL